MTPSTANARMPSSAGWYARRESRVTCLSLPRSARAVQRPSAPRSHDEAATGVEVCAERVHLVALHGVVPVDDLERPSEAAAFELGRMRFEDQPPARQRVLVAPREVLIERLARVAVVGVVVRERHHIV